MTALTTFATPSTTSSQPSSRLSTPESSLGIPLPEMTVIDPESDSGGYRGKFVDKDVTVKGSMLPPPIPNKNEDSGGHSVPLPTPPRMTRLPSLQQISDRLHIHPSPSSTPSLEKPKSDTQTTPPSLKIQTNPSIISQSPSSHHANTLNQSPFAPSPSSRLRLPASAVMRTLSGGGSGAGGHTSRDLTISPGGGGEGSLEQPSFISGNPSPKPLSSNSSSNSGSTSRTISSDKQESSNMNSTDPFIVPSSSSASTSTAIPPRTSDLSSGDTASSVAGPSTESYIQGYKDVPSLAEIRHRLSVSVVSNPGSSSTVSEDDQLTQQEIGIPEKGDSDQVGDGAKESGDDGKNEMEEEGSVTPTMVASSAVQPKKQGHPLQHAWTFYFDSKSYKPDPQITTTNAGEPFLDDYEKSLLTVGKFDTVEGFARYMNNVRLPSQLARTSNYHLFKNGIRPMWEDPANANGGKWVLLIRSAPHLLDIAWANLAMALVGEILDPDDGVCGIVASTRPKVDRLQVWTRSREDVDGINGIGRRILEALGLDPKEMEAVSMEFQYNASNSSPQPGRFLHVPFGPSRTTSLSFSGGPNSLVPNTPLRLGNLPSSPLSHQSMIAPTPPPGFGMGSGLQPPVLTNMRRSSSSTGNGSNAFSGPMGSAKSVGSGNVVPSGTGSLGLRRGSSNNGMQSGVGVRVGKENTTGGW